MAKITHRRTHFHGPLAVLGIITLAAGAWWIVTTDRSPELSSSNSSLKTPDSEIATLDSANPAAPSGSITRETSARVKRTGGNLASPLGEARPALDSELAVEVPSHVDPSDGTWAEANPSDGPELARAEAAIPGTRIEAASYSYGTAAEAEALDRERERQGLVEPDFEPQPPMPVPSTPPGMGRFTRVIPRTTPPDSGKPLDIVNEAEPVGIPANPQVELPDVRDETGGEVHSTISKAATLSTNFAGPFKRTAIVADISATVGPNHLLTTLNDDITIQDKVGTQLSKFSLLSFFSGLPGITDVFDPRCAYDHTVDRFYIAAVVQRRSTKAGVVLAVSATNNPLGAWHKWHFIADQDGTINEWADYPYLGFSNDKITASSNMFAISNDAFTGNEVFVFDKSTALDGGAITTNQFSQTNVAGMAPAITYDNTNTQFIIQRFFGDFGGVGLLQAFSVTGPPSAPVLAPLSPKPSSSPWNQVNPAAPQSGTTNKVLTNDDRLGNVVLRNGSLWTTACVGMLSGSTTVPTRTAIRWWQINSATMVTTQTGLIQDTTNTFFYYFPTITVNANNEAMLGFSGSSASTFISAMFAYRGPTTAAGTTEAPAVIKAGEDKWTQTSRRWGDYTMTVTDPSDGLTMWTLQEYTKTGGANWGTWWGRIGGGTGDTSPPTVADATALNPTTIRISFSEPMADNADLVNATFYTFSVSGGGVPIIAISVARVDSTRVDVTTNVMTAGATYTAFVSTASPTDLAGNHVNPVSNTTPFTGNTTLPTPILTSTAGAPDGATNVTPIPVTVTFNVPVTGFDLTDVSINANATKGNFAGSGATYTFNLTPTSEGQVTAEVPAGAATDAGTNSSAASNVFSRTFDSTAPTASMGSNASDPTGSSPIPVTVTFSENMTGFTSTDVVATGATVANFTTVNASTYTFNLNSPANGLVTASIAGGIATDPAGNANSAATQFSRTFDSAKPTVALASTAATNTNVSPIPVTFTFSENVTGFAAGDLTIGNATASEFSGSGTSYSVNLTPNAEGAVTVSVAASSVQDSAGNSNNASGTLTRTSDTVAPVPVMSSVSTSPTNTTPITLNINFAENVSGFTTGDVVVSGATKGTFSGSGSTFSLILTPMGEGTVTANIAAAKLTDTASNQNTAAAPFSINFDDSQPGVTITSSATNPTSTSPIPIVFTFSESVTGFAAADITVANGTKGALSGSGASYSMNVTPTAPGAVTVDIPANGAQDGAANQNTAATQFSINFDNAVPTVTLSSTTSANTNDSPIPVTATFSKAVFGFTAGDVAVTNASVSGFIGTDGDSVYTFNVTPTAEGAVTVSVPANAAQDASTNNNQASNVLNRTYDATQPGVSMASVSSDPANSSPIALTITFTEAVTGFVNGDIVVTGATASGFSGSGANYSVNLAPTAQGTVTASIAGGVAQDGASNGNTAAAQFSRTFDNAAPSVVLSTTATNPTGISPIPVTATFNEDVTGFAQADVAVTNATKSNFVAVTAKVYTFNLTPSAQGSVTASVGASTAQDGAGNQNTASNTLSVTFDDQAPTVSMTSVAANPTSTSPIVVTITFSESVAGFVNNDIVVANAAQSLFSGSGANYSVTLTPSGQGLVTAGIAANTATDGAGNNNTAAPQFSRTFDNVPPSIAISSPEPNPTGTSPFAVGFDFTEPVTGFVNTDIIVANGTKSGFSGSGASYSVNITPTAPGPVTLDIGGLTAIDAANNGNTAATQFSRTFDNSAPSVALTSVESPGPTNTSPIPMTATFNEPVNGFTAADINPANAAVNNFTGVDGDTVYTFSLVPSGQGAVTAQVAAAAATDLTGNSSSQSSLFAITFDNIKPSVSLTSAAGNPANTSPIPVTVTFSEAVTGFTIVDISTTGGTASLLTGSGANYSFILTPSGQGNVSATVVANGTTDGAGNTNTVSSAITRTFDSVAPTTTISSTQSSPTMNASIPITVTFSESVTGFVVGDVAVTNGTKSGFSGSGASYSLTVTPTAQGVVTVNVSGATGQDTAGNNNTAASQFSITFDSVQPGVSMSSAVSDPANATPILVSVSFTESVTSFTSGDVAVTNAVLGGFAGSGAGYSFNLAPSGQGLVTASIGAGVAQDSAGNTNTAAVQFSRTFDNVRPSVSISSSLISPTSTSPIPIAFTFSESVSGFTNSDVTVTNGTKSGFAGSGALYSVSVTPTAEGVVTVNVGAGLAQDAALNTNTAATQFSITFDGSAPTPALSSAAPTVTNTTPIPVTVNFGESVSGFGLSAVEVTNATKGNFAGSGSTYTFDLTPIGQGPVTASIPAGSATDASSNANNASAIFTRTFDSTQPTVALTTSAANPTNTSPIPVTITFSEPVTGFVIGDVVVTNATKSGFAGSGASYSVNVVPSGQGAVTATVNAGAAQDTAGNNNTAGNVINRTFDSVQPGVSMASTASPGPTNVSPIPVTVTFTENVTGFAQADVTATNATISGFAGSGASYSFGLVPTTSNGTVTASIAGGAAQDGAGNNSTASTQFSIDFNSTNPTVVMTSATAVVTNITPIPVTVTFSETVTGFTSGDITASNGTVGGFSGSGAAYSFNLTPTGQGDVTANIAGGIAQDAGTNPNDPAPQFSRTFDTVAPTVSMTSTASPGPTKTSPIPVTVTFNEPVTGFASGDIVASNATVGGFSGSGASYSFTLTPTGQGTVTANIAGSVAQDTAGNNNSAAPQFSIVFDNVAPSVTITSSATSPTNADPIPFTATFSQGVTGFAQGDITASNGTVGNFAVTNAATYTFTVAPTGDGTVTVDIPAGIAQDSAANGNQAASQFSITSDETGPTATLSSAASNPTNSSPLTVLLTFSEAVTGLTQGEIVASGATVGSLSGSGASYSIQLTGLVAGTVTVNVAGGVAQDAAGNNNSAAAQFSRVFDGAKPSVSMTSAASNPTKNSPIPVTATFTESVTGFAASDISVTNGNVTNFTPNSGTQYVFNVIPSADGLVTVNIPGGVAQDSAGNTNNAATALSRTFDGTAPTVSMSSAAASPTNNDPIAVTVTFSESISGFALTDVVVGNGTASGLSPAGGTGSSFTFNIAPTAPGAVTANIAAGVAVDTATNGNAAAAQFSRTFDNTLPAITLTTTASNPTKNSPIPVTATFNEPVTGFALGDITAGNAALSNFQTQSSTVYTFSATPTVAVGMVTVNVAGGVAQDSAGNGNSAAGQLSRTFDSQAPTVTMTSAEGDPTNSASIAVTVTFSESVTGFTSGDIVTSNATVGGFSGSGANYSFNLLPAADGAATASIPGGAAVDSATNGNVASSQFSRVFDSSAPTVMISSSGPDPTNSSPILITIKFSEPVTGITIGDFIITNGTPSGFAGSGTMFSFLVTPLGEGPITVSVPGSIGIDPAGNNNAASSTFSITYDGTRPSVVLATTAIDPTKNSPIPVTATFSENVTGFVSTDVSVGNGSLSNFAGSGANYSFDVVPTADGAVTVNVSGGRALDAAGNTNTAAGQLSRTFDDTAPTVALTSAVSANSPTNMNPIPLTITFSEPVTGFAVGDIVVTNASKSGFSGSGASYSVDLTPLEQGAVTAQVGPNAAQDSAANGNSESGTFSRTFDNTSPGVTIASVAANPTNSNPVPVTVTFTEAVTGFTSGDVSVTNGTVTAFTPASASEFTFGVLPSGNNVAISVNVAAGVAQDIAGNANNAAGAALNRTVDLSAPSVVMSTGASNPTSAQPIGITATFSEAVAEFTAGDVVATNATIGNFVPQSATVYTFNATPTGDGVVTVETPAASAQDSAGNGNTVSNRIEVTFDTSGPAATMTSSAPDPTNAAPISVAVSFSESVTGFTSDDITPGNATVANFAGSGSSYTFDLVPASDGDVTADIAGGVAVDAAANANTAAATFSRAYDSQAPSLVLSSVSGSPTNVSPITVTATFSEPVTDFLSTDVAPSNAAVTGFEGSGAVYTFSLVPSGQGAVSADVAGGAALDSAGNASTAAATLSRTFDSVAPNVTLSSGVSDPTNAASIPVTVTFSESVTGFTAVDITATNATVSNFAGSGASYAFDLVPQGEGTVSAVIAANRSLDAANNGNVDSAIFTRVYDSVAPDVLLSSTQPEPTGNPTTDVTVTFSENVTGFDESDLVASGATIANFAVQSGAVYTFELVPVSEPTVMTVDLPAAAANDTAGNASGAADQFLRTFVGASPEVVISSSVADPTNDTPFDMTVTFNEAVTGFVQADMSISNGTVLNFTPISATEYTFDLEPSAEGAVTVDIPADAAVDMIGNGNLAAPQFSRAYDVTGPTVTLASTEPQLTGASTIPVTVTFNEAVSDFTLADISTTNATATSLVPQTPSSFTFFLNPAGQGTVSAQVTANSVVDLAGNQSSASEVFDREVDTLNPLVESITILDLTPTAATEIHFRVTFTESVSGVDIEPPFADFAVDSDDGKLVSSSSVTMVSGSGAVYDVTVDAGAGDGALLLTVVDDDSIVDSVGNPLGGPGANNGDFTEGEHYDIDREAPVVSIASPVPSLAKFDTEVRFVIGYPESDEITLGVEDVRIVAESIDDFQGRPIDPVSNTTDTTTSGDAKGVGAFPPFDNNPDVPTADFRIEETGPQERTVVLTNLTGNGPITLFISAGTARDALGNLSGEAANHQSVLHVDNAAPLVSSITANNSERTNANSVSYGVKFTEAIVDSFTSADITVTGTLSSAVHPISLTGSGDMYTVTIAPLDEDVDGTLGITIGTNVFDVVGNRLEVSNLSSTEYTIDNTPPSFGIGPPSLSATDNGPVEFVVSYIEANSITLSPSDVQLIATGDAFGEIGVSGSGTTGRVVTIDNIIGDGTLAITIAANTATDIVGNPAVAATASTSFTVDNSPLNMQVSPPSTGVTQTGPVSFTVSYVGAETITLSPLDITINATDTASGEIAVSGTGKNTRIVTISGISGQGSLGITIAAGTATDLVNEQAPGATSGTFVVDANAPQVSVSGPSLPATTNLPVTYTVAYTDATAITLAPSDVVLNKTGSAAATVLVTGSGLTERTVTLTDITGSGTLGVSVLAGTATDAAGNSAPASDPSAVVVVDNESPTVTVSQAPDQQDPALALPINFRVLFSEPVTGFDASDVAVGGSATGVVLSTSGSGDTYTISVVQAETEGLISVAVRANAAEDAAGNRNSVSTGTDVTVTLQSSGCVLGSVSITGPPDGATIFIDANAPAQSLTILSEVDCPEDTLLVSYTLDGVGIGMADAPPYAVTIGDLPAIAGEGTHVIVATAESLSATAVSFQSQIGFTVTVAATTTDTDLNGIPDDPFTTLTTEGDTWTTTVTETSTGKGKAVGATKFGKTSKQTDEGSVTMSVESPTIEGVVVTVEAPRALVEDGEDAILILLVADDLDTLLGVDQAALLGEEPSSGLVVDGQYAEVTVLISDDGGATFAEVDDARVEANPVHYMISGVGVSAGGNDQVFTHPSRVTTDANGVQIAGEAGEWTTDNVANTGVSTGVIESDLVSLSLVAPFIRPLGAVLQATPNGLAFGEVPAGSDGELTLSVTNVGDALLEGVAGVSAPFGIVSGGSYSIAPGGPAHEIVVRFAPGAAGDFNRVLTLTGGGGANITVTGAGLSTTTGCAASGASSGAARPTDVVVTLLAAAALYALGQRRRRV